MIHLHVHSGFSFEDGANQPEELAAEAARLDMSALALTDRDALYGAVRFQDACSRVGIQAIHGAVLTMHDGMDLLLLCETPEGYRNLSRILAKAHLQNPRNEPHTRMPWLRLHHEGLICLTGSRQSRLVYLVRAQRYSEAKNWLDELRTVFGAQNLYIQLERCFRPGDAWITARLMELADHMGLPVVASADVRYATPKQFPAHDILLCAKLDISVAQPHPLRGINTCNSLQHALDWPQLFEDRPDAVQNTLLLAQRCTYNTLPQDHNLFPRFPVKEGETPEGVLKLLVRQGAKRRFKQITPEARKRLTHELQIICQLGYADYFLAVWDLGRFADDQSIRHTGRGSAADSAVAYCLNLTSVDSIRRGLPFERFLSMERSQKPDIDIDFDSERREEVFRYVREKYGEEHVGMVCTFQTFRARSAIRLVGQSLGISAQMVDYFAKHIPWMCHADALDRAFDKAPELLHSGLSRQQLTLWVYLCAQISGLPHHFSTHLGGIVISRVPVCDISPMQMSPMDRRVLQFDKDDVERIGFIKLDLLSLKTLHAVEEAEGQIMEIDPGFRVTEIPYDDPEVYKMIRAGETIGAFQIESPAQRSLHVRLNSDHQNDLDVSVALIRPGPIGGNMVEPFVNRRNGVEQVAYLHPDLEPILRHTCGVPVFQEQIIMIATVMAGFTPGESDHLRKTMTHNRSQLAMEEIGTRFVSNSMQRGYTQELAQMVFEWIFGFAGYGFCEAHAASFGDTAYKTAWMLHYHPGEYMAAILSSQPMGYYPVNTIAQEARRRGVQLVQPDINLSKVACKCHNNRIRLGFCRIGGMRRAEMDAIEEGQPFTDLEDLCRRAEVKRDSLESLAMCGAFDSWHRNRRMWLSRIPEAIASVNDGGLVSPRSETDRSVANFSPWEQFMLEWQLMGLTVNCHVMTHLRERMYRLGFYSSADLKQVPNGMRVSVAGLVTCPHRPPTRSGRRVMFFGLEDEFGQIECALFEPAYQTCGHQVLRVPVLAAEGTLVQKGRGRSIIVDAVWPMEMSVIETEERNSAGGSEDVAEVVASDGSGG